MNYLKQCRGALLRSEHPYYYFKVLLESSTLSTGCKMMVMDVLIKKNDEALMKYFDILDDTQIKTISLEATRYASIKEIDLSDFTSSLFGLVGEMSKSCVPCNLYIEEEEKFYEEITRMRNPEVRERKSIFSMS